MEGQDRVMITDWWGSLYFHALMPPWSWSLLRVHCRTCDQMIQDERNGVRWPTWDKDGLRQIEARMTGCNDGDYIINIPFAGFFGPNPDRQNGCLLHELRPEWDRYYVGRPFIVQDMSRFPLRLLDDRAHSSPQSLDRYLQDLLPRPRPFRREDCR